MLTPVNLAETVLQLQLLEGEARDALRPLAERSADARELAQDLLRRDWLTPYQVNQLFLGRGRDLILGPYVYLERLGEGGMGQVFKARQRHLNRIVALKVIRKECTGSAKHIKRFEREMQAIGQLRHPNIVHAHDADQIDGVCFIAMEYMDGTDLARLLKQAGPLMVTQACDYVRQAALGLQHAHEQGLIHRDIKPANLFLTRSAAGRRSSAALSRPSSDALRSSGRLKRPISFVPGETDPYPWGVVKILDLGLARWTDPESDRTHLTQVGSLMGTPDFIAPEQARNSSTCDIRADLYSLGCTFYFLLSGQIPFPQGAITEKLLHHQCDEPEPVEPVRRRRLLEPDWVALHGKPTREATHVPAAVDAVLRKLMAKKPEDRFQTPGDLAAHLSKVLVAATRVRKSRPLPRPASMAPNSTIVPGRTTEQAPLPAPPLPADKPAPAAPLNPAPLNPAKAGRQSRRRIALASVTCALCCGMLLAAMNTHRPEAAAPPPPGLTIEMPRPDTLQTLRNRIADPANDPRAIRDDLVRFRAIHFTGPMAREAHRLFGLLPSPLDRLDRTRIDKFQKFDWQPKEVVGIVGNWKIAAEARPFTSLAFSPEGAWLAAGGEDAPLRAWSTESLFVPHKLLGPLARTTRIAFSPDGQSLATASSDGTVRLWDLASRSLKTVLERQAGPILSLAYHPGGSLLATSCADGKVRLWDLKTGTDTAWEASGGAVALAFSPDGRHLVWSGRMSIGHVDLSRIEAAPRTTPHEHGALRRLVFHPDGHRLLGAALDGSLIQWSWESVVGRPLAPIKAHDKAVTDLAFSPDGSRLVTVGADSFVRSWDFATLKADKSWELRWPILAVAFAPDGRHFATANSNGTIYVFRPEPAASDLARK